MTFGIYTKGDYSQMIVSSEVDTLVYVGKATYTNREGTVPDPASPYYFTFFGTVLYNDPLASIYNFTFSAGGRDVIFFAYAPYPQKNSLIRATKDVNGLYTISISCQAGGSTTFVPQVYCFAKINTVGSGYGMNVYKSDGSISFSTTSKILIVKKYFVGSFQASNLTRLRTPDRNRAYYVGNGPNAAATTIGYIPPVDAISQTITKPILYLPAVQTATESQPPTNRYYFFELVGAYNPTTTNLEVEWAQTFASFVFNIPPTYQSPAVSNGFGMIADGADYD